MITDGAATADTMFGGTVFIFEKRAATETTAPNTRSRATFSAIPRPLVTDTDLLIARRIVPCVPTARLTCIASARARISAIELPTLAERGNPTVFDIDDDTASGPAMAAVAIARTSETDDDTVRVSGRPTPRTTDDAEETAAVATLPIVTVCAPATVKDVVAALDTPRAAVAVSVSAAETPLANPRTTAADSPSVAPMVLDAALDRPADSVTVVLVC